MAGAYENDQSGNLKSARIITGAGASRGRNPARPEILLKIRF